MTFGIGQEPFLNAGCKISNCIATNNRSLFNQSDGIIIHAGNYAENDLPTHRFPRQRFIFFNFETLPEMSRLPCFSRRHFYNWTMTHRRDSDVYIADQYGGIRRKASSPLLEQLPPILPPSEQPVAPVKLMKYVVQNHPRLVKKNKLVAWFCSNKKTHGRREDYFRELGKYITIDIYGNCGNKSCMPNELNRDKCDELLDEYKFYLSAENSLCADYVSEKFYRALRRDIIPVVYGGADYSAYAPPHSYIHVADFPSPKELAEYLMLLDKNQALYLKYFDWKKDYEVVRWPQDGWCDLCAKLNDPQEPSKSYESVAKWWYDDVPCYPGTSFLRTEHNSYGNTFNCLIDDYKTSL